MPGPWADKAPRGVPGQLRFMCLYGSYAHGLETPTSDMDWRGVYQLPTDDLLGLEAPKGTFERRDLEIEGRKAELVCWELSHFARLLLKGNPNIVGMMFAPPEMVTTMEWPVQQFWNMRREFVTKAMASAYFGWVMTERKVGEGLTSKRASHLLRLTWELMDALATGEPSIRLLPSARRTIMAIKTGETPIRDALDVIDSQIELVRVMERDSALPDPPTEKVRQIVVEARHRSLGLA